MVSENSRSLGVLGSGAIACGVAVAAARSGLAVSLWARTSASLTGARARLQRLGEDEAAAIGLTTSLEEAARAGTVVEAITEHHDAKTALYAQLHGLLPEDGVLATTTSSLSIRSLARAAPEPRRFAGFHVFNPVPRMPLVEVCVPSGAHDDVAPRLFELANALGKTAIQVPDEPGFLVNQLLFPFLFTAVDFHARSGLPPELVDNAFQLGAGHPMGPLALLDFVGLDVAIAIATNLGIPPPARLAELVESGCLGRKTGSGFYSYPAVAGASEDAGSPP